MPLSMTDANIQQYHVPTHFLKTDVKVHDAHEDKVYVDLNTTIGLVTKSWWNIIYGVDIMKGKGLKVPD